MRQVVITLSRYTTEVRYICETSAGLDESVGYSDIEQVIKNSLANIFDFDFPIFDEKYRSVLETKILRHYYTREIAHETVGLWKLKLCTKLNEIMPYYNQLYKSELISFNPMYDVDLTRQRKVDSSGTRDTDTSESGHRTSDVSLKNDTTNTDNSTTTESGNKKQMYSDTPQGTITDLEAGKYLTNATIDNTTNTDTTIGNGTGTQTGSTNTKEETETNTTSSTDITNLENYIETVKGKQGTQSYTSLLKEFRETFLNIDMMIIEDLSELFFGLWT